MPKPSSAALPPPLPPLQLIQLGAPSSPLASEAAAGASPGLLLGAAGTGVRPAAAGGGAGAVQTQPPPTPGTQARGIIAAHGALALASFGALLPAGALFSAARPFVGERRRLRVLLLAGGTVVALASVLVGAAASRSGGSNGGSNNSVTAASKAHVALGVLAFVGAAALAGIEGAALWRSSKPHAGQHARRRAALPSRLAPWLATAALAAGAASCLIGSGLLAVAPTAGVVPVAAFIVPAALLLGLWLLAAALVAAMRRQLARARAVNSAWLEARPSGSDSAGF